MPQLSIIRPLDQPTGNRRLLGELKKALTTTSFTDLRFIIAFAKSGPLLRLKKLLTRWHEHGNTSSAIFGIDHRGTSREALDLALSLFDSVYVTNANIVTFHPKIYIFSGDASMEAFVGSNNLTVGGTETNFESTIHLTLDRKADNETICAFESLWNELLPAHCTATTKLSQKILEELVTDGIVPDEAHINRHTSSSMASHSPSVHLNTDLVIQPPSPIPVAEIKKVDQRGGDLSGPGHDAPRRFPVDTARRHVIQIKPHHNGEIMLSMTGVMQNPAFFGWPFTGKTKPKKSNNPTYPQLDPDPLVNITVYSAETEPILTLKKFALNTVYYERNREIRITASPLVGTVPEYSIMIIDKSNDDELMYDITILTPDNSAYTSWVEACDQLMPSGGKQARKFGWF